MLCGVTATLGSNPSATATAARPQWGRAVLLCLTGVSLGGGFVSRVMSVWGCFGARVVWRLCRARVVCVPVGGFVVPGWCASGVCSLVPGWCASGGGFVSRVMSVWGRLCVPVGGPPAVRAASFAGRVVSKPGQAPPPAGTVAPQLCLPDHRTPSTSVGRPFEMPE